MNATVYGFEESALQARGLARELGLACEMVSVRHFPDGESLVRVERSATTAILYRSLDNPNPKLVELMLAASALRDGGATRIVLVAPYLAYMRQDIAFHPGEAVSQAVIGRFIASHFDALVTVDPHLHRTGTLQAVVPGIAAVTVSASGTLAAMLKPDTPPDTLLVGPDSESRPWVESVAMPLGLDVLVGEKRRLGDRQVELVLPGIERVRGRPAILVDDVISSGGTMLSCADQLRAAGATRVDAIAAHCLASAEDLATLAAGGIGHIRSTDSVPGATAAASIAPAIADAMRRELPAWP